MICPTCKKEVEREGNPFRPFCSERCKLVDLGRWVKEDYSIPVSGTPHEDTREMNDDAEDDD